MVKDAKDNFEQQVEDEWENKDPNAPIVDPSEVCNDEVNPCDVGGSTIELTDDCLNAVSGDLFSCLAAANRLCRNYVGNAVRDNIRDLGTFTFGLD